MSPLTRKLYRDLWNIRGPALTIALVVGLGITGLLGFHGLYRELKGSRDRYYETHAYADLQLTLRRAPRAALVGLADIPGVEALEGRVVQRLSLELPGVAERLAGRIVSLPEYDAPAVNRLRLLAGRLPKSGGVPEVVVLEDFAHARGLRPGATMRVIVNQEVQAVTVAGIAASPEFVYVLPDDGGFVPEPRRYAVLWGRERLVEQLAAMTGAVNDVVVRAGRGTDPAALLTVLERRLANYGVFLADARADMPAYALLANELHLTLVRAWTVPFIFLMAAALVLNLVLTRLVATQRVQIGTMKALGLSAPRILGHYLGYGVAISLVGAALGAWGGHRLTGLLLHLYQDFYHLPLPPPAFQTDLAVAGTLAALVSALAGIYSAGRRVLSLTPAEAMRPAPPEARSQGLVLHLRALPFLWRLSLRTILRNPFRTSVAVLGTMLAVGLLMVSRFFLEGITETNMFRFRVVQRQDLEVLLEDGVGAPAADELAHIPGVARVEAVLAHPFVVRAGKRSRRFVVEGFEPSAWLRRPRTLTGGIIPLPDEGVLLGSGVAKALGVTPGDEVELASLKGRRSVTRVTVAGTFPTYVGRNAATSRAYLARLTGEDQAASALGVAVDGDLDAVVAEITRRPGVLRVTRRNDKMAAFEENVQGVLVIANRVLVLLAGSIACGLLLNGALVGLAERRGELAVLRVQGFGRGEVGDLLLYEHVLTGLLGAVLGIPWGAGLIYVINLSVQTELLRVPYVVSHANLVRAVLFAGLFLLVSHLAVRVALSGQKWRENLAVKE